MASEEDRELLDGLAEAASQLAAPPSDVDVLVSLLDKTEECLTRIEQSPSSLTSAALQPVMKALVAKFFLDHTDEDVKISVTSCISEITRITAPDAPYDDDLMKVIFQMIVAAFRKLDDTSNRAFQKRISILDTVAKVRSCVVMLDLECDALILEMFRNFLKTIRSNHPDGVFSSMAMIMTLVLEESEDISLELLLSLLDSIKDNQDVLPIARQLGKKVIRSSISKIKPYLISYDLSDYSKIVASISEDDSDTLENPERNVSDAVEPAERNVPDEVVADESKLSERTISDELPERSETQTLEQEVASGKVGPSINSPKSATSNGRVQRVTEDGTIQPAQQRQNHERSRRRRQSKHDISVDRTKFDSLETVGARSNSAKDIKTDQKNGHDATGLIQNDSHKETPLSTSGRKGHKKKVDSSQVAVPSVKELEPASSLEPLEKDDLQAPHSSDNGTACISSPKHSGNARDKASRLKRGQPSGSKGFLKRISSAVTEQPVSTLVGEEDLGDDQTQDAPLPSEVNDSREVEAASIRGKSRRLAGKAASFVKADAATPASVTSESEARPSRSTDRKKYGKKVLEGQSPEKQKKPDVKQQIGKIRSGKDAAEDLGTKVLETAEHNRKLDERLITSKIQVWWPDDKSFYNGIVVSFDRKTGQHKIVYDDGDIETLNLKNEQYKIVEDGAEAENEGKNVQEMQRNKKARTDQDSVPKQERKVVPIKSGTDSGSKQRGRPRSRASRKPDSISPDRTKTPKKAKETAASITKDDIISIDETSDAGLKTPKSYGKTKSVRSKSGKKSKDDSPKNNSKVKGDAQAIGNKMIDDSVETPKSGSKSKDDSISGKRDRRRNKSKEGTRKGGQRPQLKENVSRKIDNESISDDMTEEEKEKVSETEAPSSAQVELATGSGKKRKRKGRK